MAVSAGAALFAAASQAQTADDERRQREQSFLMDQSRVDFLSRVGGIPVRSDRGRRQDFRRDLRSLRAQVVGIWAFRFAPMSERWARTDLENRSRELEGTLERVREYLDRDSDPPEVEPAALDGQSFGERLNRFLIVGAPLPDLVLEVVEGEVLDLALLGRVREDLVSLEFWVRELRESRR